VRAIIDAIREFTVISEPGKVAGSTSFFHLTGKLKINMKSAKIFLLRMI